MNTVKFVVFEYIEGFLSYVRNKKVMKYLKNFYDHKNDMSVQNKMTIKYDKKEQINCNFTWL